MTIRHCPSCGQEYYGELGHKGCPGPSAELLAAQQAEAIRREQERQANRFICEPCKDQSKADHPNCQFRRKSTTPGKIYDYCQCPCAPPF